MRGAKPNHKQAIVRILSHQAELPTFECRFVLSKSNATKVLVLAMQLKAEEERMLALMGSEVNELAQKGTR